MTTMIQNINTTLALLMNYEKCHNILVIMTASVLVINIYQVFIVCQAIHLFAFEGNCLAYF